MFQQPASTHPSWVSLPEGTVSHRYASKPLEMKAVFKCNNANFHPESSPSPASANVENCWSFFCSGLLFFLPPFITQNSTAIKQGKNLIILSKQVLWRWDKGLLTKYSVTGVFHLLWKARISSYHFPFTVQDASFNVLPACPLLSGWWGLFLLTETVSRHLFPQIMVKADTGTVWLCSVDRLY